MNFEERVLQFIQKNKLISSRGTVIAGVSGGADSMALLLCLAGLRHRLGISLHAVHFNHRFRPEALRDERFVAKWCGQLNIPLTVGRRAGGAVNKLSEDDARVMRFIFFAKTAQALKAQSVALAHTRNDLAETVLMRLMRGSGLYGLRAILPKRSIEGISFIRPLLGLERGDIEAYLKSKKTPYCTDATNRKMIYERNKIRHQLLPLLAKEYNPRIIDILSDLALSSTGDYEFLSKHARRHSEKIVIVSPKKVKIRLKGIARLDPAILRLVLRSMVERLTGDAAALGFEHILALENLSLQNTSATLELPHRLRASCTPEFLELRCVAS